MLAPGVLGHRGYRLDNARRERTNATLERPPAARLPLLGIVALATVLRFLLLGGRSLWFDETVSATIAGLPWPQFTSIAFGHESNMMLYYGLLRWWSHLGQSEFALRSLSALVSIATIPVLYAFASRLFGQRVALLASLLMALNAFHIRYAQEARSYSLLVFFGMLASLAFVDAVENGGGRYWVSYVAAVVLATYNHLFGAFLLPAHWASLVLARRRDVRWGRLLISSTVIVLACIPLGVCLRRGGVWESFTLPTPGLSSLRSFLFALAGGSDGAGWLFAAAAAFGIVAQRQVLRGADIVRRWRVWLLLTWFAVPVGLAWSVSMLKPVFQHKYLIFCLPPYLILVALGLTAVRPRRLFIAALALILTVSTYRVAHYYAKMPANEDWRGLTNTILKTALPDDAVVFCLPHLRTSFEYYRQRLRAPEDAGVGVVIAEPMAEGWDGARYRDVWLVLGHLTANEDRPIRDRLDHDHVLGWERAFGDIRLLRYDRRERPGSAAPPA